MVRSITHIYAPQSILGEIRVLCASETDSVVLSRTYLVTQPQVLSGVVRDPPQSLRAQAGSLASL